MLISDYCESVIKGHHREINNLRKISTAIGHIDAPDRPFNCYISVVGPIHLNYYTSNTQVAAQILKALPPSNWKKTYQANELSLTAEKDDVHYKVEISGEFCEVKEVMVPHFEMIPGTCKPVELSL